MRLCPLYSRIVWVMYSGYLSGISRWFSSAKSLKIPWNQSVGTRERADNCPLRNKSGDPACPKLPMSGSSLQHCCKLFHNCPYLGSIGGCAYHTESFPSPVSSLPQRQIVSLASDGLNPAMNERGYLLLGG